MDQRSPTAPRALIRPFRLQQPRPSEQRPGVTDNDWHTPSSTSIPGIRSTAEVVARHSVVGIDLSAGMLESWSIG